MTALPTPLIGEFIDASVRDRDKAHAETVLHFLAVEGFGDGVRFLAERGADVNAVNDSVILR